MAIDVHLKISASTLTVGDLLAFEDAQESKRPMHTLLKIISRFMVYEDGTQVPEEDALVTLSSLSMEQFNQVTEELTAAIGGMKKLGVPPGSAER